MSLKPSVSQREGALRLETESQSRPHCPKFIWAEIGSEQVKEMTERIQRSWAATYGCAMHRATGQEGEWGWN